MLSSFKSINESIQNTLDNAKEQAKNAVGITDIVCTSTTKNEGKDCPEDCKVDLNLATMYGVNINSSKCHKCNDVFCSSCLKLSHFLVPTKMLHKGYKLK